MLKMFLILFIFKKFIHLFIHLAAQVLVGACSVFYDALTLTSWGRERWTFPGLAKSTHNNLSKSVSFICKLKSKAHTPNYCSLSTSQGAPSPKSPQVPDTRWGERNCWNYWNYPIPNLPSCLPSLTVSFSHVHAKPLPSCPALCDPMDCSPPGSSVHEILQARILKWVAISSSRGSSWPRGRTYISYVSCIGRRVLYH